MFSFLIFHFDSNKKDLNNHRKINSVRRKMNADCFYKIEANKRENDLEDQESRSALKPKKEKKITSITELSNLTLCFEFFRIVLKKRKSKR